MTEHKFILLKGDLSEENLKKIMTKGDFSFEDLKSANIEYEILEDELVEKINLAIKEKIEGVKAQNFEFAASKRDVEKKLLKDYYAIWEDKGFKRSIHDRLTVFFK